jgi:hypothetical protein
MNNTSSNPAAPGLSGRPAATLFNALPPPQDLSRAEPSRGRGRHSSRSRKIAVAFNAMPKLSTTYVGGQALPNSEAELAAYGKAMAEFVKELASYNETIEGLSRSRNRQKRSHHGNGNVVLLCGERRVKKHCFHEWGNGKNHEWRSHE